MKPIHKKWKSAFSSIVIWVMVLGTFVIASPNPIIAQEYGGRVSGVVTDPSNAAVPDATVTLRNTSTGVVSKMLTDSNGHYLFESVLPGDYSVAVEHDGFRRSLQENVTVLTTGDVTVDVTLQVGAVSQTVTVTAAPPGVQFNTTNMSMTVQGPLVRNLPIEARNPYTLALLDSAVVNTYWDTAHRNPFYMWAAGGVNIGGPTSGKNDVQLDGMSTLAGDESAYTPPMDAVQQVVVQENADNAAFGFTSGGTLIVSTRSGTNAVHGTADYFGVNPTTNALANRVTRSPNIIHQSIWGATLGFPIKRNKIFDFAAYEQWQNTQPSTIISTVPTVAERNGDFSHALTPQGAQRIIYDPFTTQFNPTTGTVTRQPFPGNIIPLNRMDRSGLMAVKNMWMPNGPGTDLSGTNNFQLTYPWWTHYWNYLNRLDYNVSDNLRLFGRIGDFRTRLDNNNWGGTIAVPSDNGGRMDSLNTVVDALYMVSPRTMFDFRFGANKLEDDFDSQWAQVSPSVWANMWPNGWFKPVLSATAGQGLYYPSISFTGDGNARGTYPRWWFVHERVLAQDVSITHDSGIQNMSVGLQFRYTYNHDNQHTGPGGFQFNSIDTGNTFLSSYNPAESGDMYASALLGAVDSGYANIAPIMDVHEQMWALYYQDNIKLTKNITLNLGLRWEYQTGPAEVNHKLNGGVGGQTLNLNTPIQPLVNLFNRGQLQIPSQVTSIAKIPYKWAGAMEFTSGANPRAFNPPWANFLPRAGIAIRLNDKTAIRAGYARYMVPLGPDVILQTELLPSYGYSAQTQMIGPIQGVPQTLFSNPFPAGNPVLLPAGNTLGAYTDLGNPISNIWNGNVFKNSMNDRFNFSIQRQAPQKFTLGATFFMAFWHDYPGVSYNLNQMNPELAYTYKGLTAQAVPNPFYNLLSASEMPGVLRSQPTVSASQLLVPYPQYGSLMENQWSGISNHYYALQLQAERPLSHGVILLGSYNYNQDYQSQFFNDLDMYNNKTTMLDTGGPRHNLTLAGTWELPIGRGRSYLSGLNPILDGIIGGWSTSQIFTWRSGDLLQFGQAAVTGNPLQNVPAGHYFNPEAFQVAPAFTLRTNPWYYPGLRGPAFWDLDSSLVKSFRLSPERVRLQLRFEFFNMPNVFMPADPVTAVGAGSMGQTIGEGNYGRKFQYAARLLF